MTASCTEIERRVFNGLMIYELNNGYTDSRSHEGVVDVTDRSPRGAVILTDNGYVYNSLPFIKV